MQKPAEEILSPLSVKQDRRIAGLTPNFAANRLVDALVSQRLI